jgi:hypothetical protein
MTGISTGHRKPALKIALPQPAILGKLCELLAWQEPAYRAAQEAPDEQNVYPKDAR